MLHLPLIWALCCWELSKKTSSTSFLSLWYDSTWDWTRAYQAIGKHSHHYAIYILQIETLSSKMSKKSIDTTDRTNTHTHTHTHTYIYTYICILYFCRIELCIWMTRIKQRLIDTHCIRSALSRVIKLTMNGLRDFDQSPVRRLIVYLCHTKMSTVCVRLWIEGGLRIRVHQLQSRLKVFFYNTLVLYIYIYI